MIRASQWWRYIAGANWRPSYAVRWLAVTALVEAGTGLVLMVRPTLFVRLLLGAELSEVGQALGRLADSLCSRWGWPAGRRRRHGAERARLFERC